MKVPLLWPSNLTYSLLCLALYFIQWKQAYLGNEKKYSDQNHEEQLGGAAGRALDLELGGHEFDLAWDTS